MRYFKKNFGTTPYNYLLNRKIEIAKSLLSSSSWPIKNIAYALSFSDEQYFSCAFTKKTGISPKKYRDKYSNYQKPISTSKGDKL